MSLPRRRLGIVILALFALSAFSVVTLGLPAASAASAQPQRSLSLTPLPPKLPTSSSGASSFPALVVSIKDAQGNPLISPNATTVYLSSSESAVLSVQSTVVIPAGAQYAIADVTTTATPGNSTVTAVSPGFNSASANFQTSIARGYPTQLRVFPLPGGFPAGVQSVATYAVIVLDAAGLPARTVQSTPVNVTSSDTSILTVAGTRVPVNETVGYGSMTAVGKAGSAALTASASGLVTSTAAVSVTSDSTTTAPVGLLITPPAASLPANGGTYNVLTVSLVDSNGLPAIAQSLVQIFLTSSRTDLVTTPAVVNVPVGASFVEVPVTTSSAFGSAVITASAPNFVSSSAGVSSVSIPPTRLGVYLSDSQAVVSKTANTLEMVVQLQDSSGVPAEARAPASVIVSYSNSSLMKSPMTLTIPKGSDLVYASVPLSQAASGTFTAISNGLASGAVRFSAAPLKVVAALSPATSAVTQGQGVVIYLSLRVQGNPVGDASVAWSSADGTFSSVNSTTNAAGSSSVTFYPSVSGLDYITVTVTNAAVGDVSTSLYLTVTPPKQANSLLSKLLSFPYILIIVGAAAAAVIVAVVLVRRRRRRGAEAEAALSEDEQGFSYLRRGLGQGPWPGALM